MPPPAARSRSEEWSRSRRRVFPRALSSLNSAAAGRFADLEVEQAHLERAAISCPDCGALLPEPSTAHRAELDPLYPSAAWSCPVLQSAEPGCCPPPLASHDA